ncbi:hypothetical protein, partial [Paracoccus solventivorans]|uniref:hypothetical protein n=1 Tax=Paracoccus solventivorans TaxID=53463 RepID=UPI0026EFE2FF
ATVVEQQLQPRGGDEAVARGNKDFGRQADLVEALAQVVILQLGLQVEYPCIFRELQALHRMRAVERSVEYRRGETASGPIGAEAGAQPLPHNPRK